MKRQAKQTCNSLLYLFLEIADAPMCGVYDMQASKAM